MKYLILNLGSASRKYLLYYENNQQVSSHYERKEEGHVMTFNTASKKEIFNINENDYKNSIEHVLGFFIEQKIIDSTEDIDFIGMRIVAPGKFFQEHREVDEEYLNNLVEAQKIAPLHLDSTITALKEIKELLPKAKLFGVSDSAFHKTIKEEASRYALPKDITEKNKIYRFGYHGISVNSIVRRILKSKTTIPRRTIVCHIGSGSSVTALLDGVSIDTTMGYTPLEGVIMGTRTGNIDAGAILALQEQLSISPLELKEILNRSSGLLGVSGVSSDVRDLLEEERKGNSDAKLALDMFTYSIRKNIGSMIAALNGVDMVIFTGTIGERSPIIRERICNNLEWLGISTDTKRNYESTEIDKDHKVLSLDESKVKVVATIADENEEILFQVKEIITGVTE